MPRPELAGTPPPGTVLAAFELTGVPVQLAGGQGASWRVGEAVVKPLDLEPAMVAWQGAVLAGLNDRDDFRVSVPLRTADGSWIVNGWTAWRYQRGTHLAQRWQDIVSVGHRLHAALETEPKPAFFGGRTDRWAIADKVAWGELPAADYAATQHVSRLVAALRPLDGRCQVIHGDLTGNVMFDDDLPPLVIDLSLYWRPPAFASAIVIADALVFEGAPEDVAGPLLDDPAFPQYLLRALIYRAVSDRPRADSDDPYLPAVEFAIQLAGSS